MMKKIDLLHIVVVSLVISDLSAVFSQCPVIFPPAIADGDCTELPVLPSGNTIIGVDDTYGFCATSSDQVVFNSLNFQGGELWICGNITLTSYSLNSGIIVVTCGSELTLSGNTVLNNNMRIYNYGTININGNLEFQNNNNLLYNETENSRLFVTGNLIFPQNNGQDAFFKNNGYMNISQTFNARNGGYTCLGESSVLLCNNLNYATNCGGPANRFSYSGGSSGATIRYNNSASIRSSFTTDHEIDIQQATGGDVNFHGCGSWGNANFTTDAPPIVIPPSSPLSCTSMNCFITLSVELVSFHAKVSNHWVELTWITASETNNDFFTIERSNDGKNWNVLTQIRGIGESDQHTTYNYTDVNPHPGNYYRLKQTNFDGKSEYLKIIVVNLESNREHAVLYYRPSDNSLSIHLKGIRVADVNVYTILGTDITKKLVFRELNDELSVDTSILSENIYIIKIKNDVHKVNLKKQ